MRKIVEIVVSFEATLSMDVYLLTILSLISSSKIV
ncbi:hypothetical protein HRbin06_00585 [archaeon HR06]|nr:hypothetical protein HRbin06_00585 [archaeon HR06]